MFKKLVGIGVTSIIAFSLVGCGSGDEANEKSKEQVNNAKAQEFNINQDKFTNLKGDWIKDFTKEDFDKTGNDLIKKVKEQSEAFGLKVEESDKVDTVVGQTAKVKSVYLDNKNPEDNKLESMQFEEQVLGESGESGRFEMKLSLKFNGEKALKEGKFNLGDTSLPKYAEIMTGVKDRNYGKINDEILKIVKSDKKEGVFEDDINGLVEEFAVSKEYIVYTLSTKEYKFVQGNSNGI